MRGALLLAVAAACAACTPPERYACVDGLLYRQFSGGAWVLQDGRGFIGFPDGPMKCAPLTKD